MTVTKRLRYEILRRDNHTCRYCGGIAPEAVLTIDHVLPTALGGSDGPDNLVAACKDCNAGKAASNPDDPLIEQVSADAVRWARAVEAAAIEASLDFVQLQETREIFDSAWQGWTHKDRQGNSSVLPRPKNWADSIDMFGARGLPPELLEECVRITMARKGVDLDQRFTYFCGVAWKKVNQIDRAALTTYNEQADGGPSADYVFPAKEYIFMLISTIVDAMGAGPDSQQDVESALSRGMGVARTEYAGHMLAGNSEGDAYHGALISAESAIEDELEKLRAAFPERQTNEHLEMTGSLREAEEGRS